MGRGALQATVCGVTEELVTTEQLNKNNNKSSSQRLHPHPLTQSSTNTITPGIRVSIYEFGRGCGEHRYVIHNNFIALEVQKFKIRQEGENSSVNLRKLEFISFQMTASGKSGLVIVDLSHCAFTSFLTKDMEDLGVNILTFPSCCKTTPFLSPSPPSPESERMKHKQAHVSLSFN